MFIVTYLIESDLIFQNDLEDGINFIKDIFDDIARI